MRIGIFFGGASREREISFAGGRTVYDNLDKNLFEAVPIFIDSLGNLILLDWEYIYKGTIRDFYPPLSFLKSSQNNFTQKQLSTQLYVESLGNRFWEEQEQMINSVGRRVKIEELKDLIDFAFLSLHGVWGEDGSIQGILEWLNIPYSGSGILPSAIGMNKAFQKRVMKKCGFEVAKSIVVSREEWLNGDRQHKIFKNAVKKIGLPLVVRPANQGSSIGVSIVNDANEINFKKAIDAAFFIITLSVGEWDGWSEEEKTNWVKNISEIKDGTGIPFIVNGERIDRPEELYSFIENFVGSCHGMTLQPPVISIYSIFEEQDVLIEEFIDGTEFSCIVIRNENGDPIALPPTEIKKGKEIFDYRSKYLAGMTRKVTPIDLPAEQIERIRKACEKLFVFFGFHVYARIDGFIDKGKHIFLNDPNTTSGMLPSSFFFHQSAEIGLNPSQFLTYIIRTSLAERIHSQSFTIQYKELLKGLDEKIAKLKNHPLQRKRIAVILGGYSFERHISVESGRNIYEKLSSSIKYEPIPIFLIGDAKQYTLYQIPINLLLKDNADDIRDKILHFKRHPVVEKIRKKCRKLIDKYASSSVVFEPQQISLQQISEIADGVFIALHGRPGEDGQLQSDLEKFGLPYNGSDPGSSQITIDKYRTNELLKSHGFKIAEHFLMYKVEWVADKNKFYLEVESKLSYPFICKPVDDGCSAAVKKINSREELDAFCHLIFREEEELPYQYANAIHLKSREEFPRKDQLLAEELITSKGAKHFLEVTGGMITKLNGTGEIQFEVFEPSEALAGDDVLSLEEKFLAGEGQNITPARFADDEKEYNRIASIVKADLERAARILNVTGYCRIDAFVRIYDDHVETIIIEVNSLPGMTPATCIFHQAAINNYKPYVFIDKILEFSFEKQRLAKATKQP